MAEYAVSNPSTDDLPMWSGPSIIFKPVGSLGAGKTAKGDFLFTHQSKLETESVTRAFMGDQWVHVRELDGVPIDGWVAVTHLGRPKASVESSTSQDLLVAFGVELQGYNPITLTGTLTPK